MTKLVEITCTFSEKESILKVETDPTWGEFKTVIEKATSAGNSYAFFEELTRAMVKEGLPFDTKNLTTWALLPISEMTELVGKVIKVFPLGKYLDNLGFMENPIFKSFLS